MTNDNSSHEHERELRRNAVKIAAKIVHLASFEAEWPLYMPKKLPPDEHERVKAYTRAIVGWFYALQRFEE